ncbi:GtrA family protein [Massilia sp. Mn16-1_5]|uniref:GtrA family protein n=1 Tax=Massilia sp. Mn16-1_5 TaxID=2079199 RepID=UPI00109E7949|nr:GtrA family protein [Massilia sp. Mn16-1_5]THC45642.1 hypothetical protein C2862_03915 [Massilia sp. Mn16-1_5]
MKLIIVYTLLALAATVVNIGTQDVVGRLYKGPFALALAMLIGTAIGLVIKYVLDKRYIFHFQACGIGHDSRTFALYTLMGLITTAMFWSVELGFEQLFGSRSMRYLGAVLGLGVGYVAKYHLDKRYVFRTAASPFE